MTLALRPLTLALGLCLLGGCASTPATMASTGAAAPAAAPAKALTMQEILDASKPEDWRALDPENSLYLVLGNGKQALIELAPGFAPEHVANIRTLAREHYFDGLAILRSQENYVVQWGDPAEDGAKEAKPLGSAKPKLPVEFTAPAANLPFTRLPDVDGWAPEVGFSQGFPAARKDGRTWLPHCYATVGAARGNEADSSNGSGLYVIIGQAPRQLDRNITTVGRVLSGMEWLTVLPRGTGPLGFYEQPEQRMPITAVRLGSELPESQRLKLEVLRTDTPTWEALVESRRNRRDAWYINPAGHIDLCNVPIPVRLKP